MCRDPLHRCAMFSLSRASKHAQDDMVLEHRSHEKL